MNYICIDNFRHASFFNAYQGGTFAFYTDMDYTKQPLDYPQILTMLKERGLIIRDDNDALEQLKIMSYFRVANYLRPMEQDKECHPPRK